MNKRVVALVALWASVTGGMLALSACYGENCNGSSGGYGSNPGEGRMIDENTWESSPIDGKWLHYSSLHAWFFDVPALGGRVPYSIQTYISPVETPNQSQSNFTVAGGNLAELSGVGANRFIVRNGTCAEYFVRVVVQVPANPDAIAPGTPGDVDAGGDASDLDSGIIDATTD